MGINDSSQDVKKSVVGPARQAWAKTVDETAGNKPTMVDKMKGLAQSVFGKVAKVVGSLTRDPVTHRVVADEPRPREDMGRSYESTSPLGVKNSKIGRKSEGPSGRRGM